MNITYQDIISSFVDKYGLTRGQVIAEIEKAFSSMLSRWHQQNVVAMFSDGQLTALGYHHGSAEVVQIPIELTTMRGWNTIKRILDKNLGRMACLQEVARYKRKEHRVFWGEIIKKNNDRSLSVEVEIEPGVPMITTCLANHIGAHERSEIVAGQCRAFHLRRVESVHLNGTSRTQILVDRVSKNLVSGFLMSQLEGTIKIRCLKRYVGHKSFVESSGFIPKKIIMNTSRELNEHIQVKVRKK